MSAAISSCCSCPTPEIVQVPGSAGAAGAPGPNIVNSTTATDATLAAGFVTVPGGVGVVGSVANPFPIVNGGTGAATQAAGLTALLGASVVPVANGGTAGSTKTTAQAGLGLGQAPQVSILAAPVQLASNAAADTTATLIAGGLQLTIPAAGVYLLLLAAQVSAAAATLTTQVCTIEIRKNAAAITGANVVKTALPITTTTGTIMGFEVIGFSTFAASDVVNVYATFSAVTGAGTVSLASGTIIAIPLALS